MVTFFGLLLIILASFIGSDGAGPSYSSSCFESECNGATIKYPFWKIDPNVSTVHCGYSGFGVNCSTAVTENSYPILALPNDTDSYYYVTSFDHVNRSVTLVDSDVLGETCPRPRRNITVGSVPLHYTSADVNLSFYFNCSMDANNITAASSNRITCLEGYDGKGSYVFTEGKEAEGFDWVGQCEEKVVAAVKESEAAAGVGSVKEGFMMEWQAHEGCRPCEESGGKCGFDHRTWQPYCFCGNTTSNSKCPGTGNNLSKVYIGVSSGVFGILSMAIIVYCIKKHRPMLFKKQSPSMRDIEEFIRRQGSVAPKRFGYSEVKRMTNAFRDKLGQGGFGAVYKGKLPEGTLVAVKLLNSAKGNGEDFVNEVASISRTAHVNIVSLLGFCFESEKRALIYEFMPNGSLDGYIKCHVSPVTADVRLGWDKLYQIAIGVAKGLEYLHHGCSTRILHLDIKPQNILLDNEYRPKIADFGLSTLCLGRESVITSLRARGTIGYIAPEVLNRNYGGVSHKSDVHSYGMMLIEMVGGSNYLEVEADDNSEIYFYDEVYRLVEPGRSPGFNDPLTAIDKETEIARKMALVGIWCIQADPRQRPSISKVIEMLEGSTEALPVPPKPSYFSPMRSPTVSSSMLGLH